MGHLVGAASKRDLPSWTRCSASQKELPDRLRVPDSHSALLKDRRSPPVLGLTAPRLHRHNSGRACAEAPAMQGSTAGKGGRGCLPFACLRGRIQNGCALSLSSRLLLIMLMLWHKKKAPEPSLSTFSSSSPPPTAPPQPLALHRCLSPKANALPLPRPLNFKTTRQCGSNMEGQDIKSGSFLRFPR